MTDIDIHAKTDRELLIMAIEKLNGLCDKVEKHEQTLYNAGWGITAQIKVIWGVGVIVLGIILKSLYK